MMANYRVCGCFTRKYKLESLDPPVEVKGIFDRYSEGGHMSVKNLQMFLQECQGNSSATENDAESAMDVLRQKRLTNAFQHHKHTLNLEGFLRFLFCDDLNNALQSQVHHDMTAPLSDYYIYTGHNSYLTGNQLSSDCSDLPIIKALNRGVRVIELDIWPNGDKDDVHVLHGRTLTSPVALIKCLRSIKDHAFDTSEYPLIITLEDHLNRDLQAKTAKMITETFGELLYFPDKEDGLEVFPSPEFLKNRIIISTKPPKEYLERKDSNVSDKQEKDRQKESEESAWGDEFDYRKADMQKIDSGMGEDDVFDNDDGDEDDDEENSCSSNKTAAPEYKRIITIRAGKPKGSIRDALNVDEKHVKRVSLSEPQLEKIANSHPKDIVRFTQKNLLRIYPKGTRVTSTNYNPLIAWTHGAQMVALNMQGYGRALWLMHGFFRANGGCGYVKKPDFLLPKNGGYDVFNPKAPRPVKTTLKVKVYMGEGWNQDFKKTHFDMYSPPDFYTRIGIAGVPADMVMRKTKSIEDNWMPHWNEEFSFPLTIPELALLRVEVHEYDMSEKDDFAGQTCLPVSELRTGIRVLPLHDRKGEKYNNVKLLVRIEFISH